MSTNQLIIELNQQPIELCKLLKIANMVSGGGEAKIVISEGYVYLNGEVEYQKRKKVYHDDIIEFNGDTIQVLINENLPEQSNEDSIDVDNSNFVDTTQKEQIAKPKKTKNKKMPVVEIPDVSNDTTNIKKRRPISF